MAKKLVTHTPEEILADYKPTRSSGRACGLLLGLLLGLLFGGVWVWGQQLAGHQTQIERFPDYWQSCWEWPGFRPKPGQLTLDRLKCRVYRYGNLHHQYDRAIQKAHWYPVGKPDAVAYTPLYSSSPFRVIALPATALLVAALGGFLYGLYRRQEVMNEPCADRACMWTARCWLTFRLITNSTKATAFSIMSSRAGTERGLLIYEKSVSLWLSAAISTQTGTSSADEVSAGFAPMAHGQFGRRQIEPRPSRFVAALSGRVARRDRRP